MDSIKADVTGAADQGGTGLMKASSPVSRRTVVATGVAAAWTIPVIQLATAAPALAASSPTTTLTWNGFTAAYANGVPTKLQVTATVTNGAVAAHSFTITLTLPAVLNGATVTSPTGWTVTPDSSGLVFSFVPSAPVPASSTQTFTAMFTVPDAGGGVLQIPAAATATNADTASANATVAGLATTLAFPTTPSGSYGATGADPKNLVVTVPVKNTGTHAASAVTVALNLDSSFAGITPPAVNGWTPSTPNGSVYTYTRTNDLASGQSDQLSVTFPIGTTTGKAFTMGVEVSASNAPAVHSSADVRQATTTLSWTDLQIGYAGSDATKINVTPSVGNSGGADATNIQLQLTLTTGQTPTIVAPTGWALTSTTPGSGTTTFLFTWQSPSLGAGAGNSTTFAFGLSPADGRAVKVSATVSADNAPSVSHDQVTSLALAQLSIDNLSSVWTTGTGRGNSTQTVHAKVSSSPNTGAKPITQVSLTITLNHVPTTITAASGWVAPAVSTGKTYTFTYSVTNGVPNPVPDVAATFKFPGNTNPASYTLGADATGQDAIAAVHQTAPAQG